MSIEDFYQKIYNQQGVLSAIYVAATGRQLIFYPETKTFDESDSLTIQLRQREVEEGEALDLTDSTPPANNQVAIRLNSLVESYRVIPATRFPSDINYNTGLRIGLTTETLDYFGLRIAQVFYQSLDPETNTAITPVPIVFERYKYVWDSNSKLPLSRVKEIQFYQEDGNLTEQKKLLPKEFYNTSDRAEIVYRRRQCIVNWLIARAAELGLETEVNNYFALYKDQTDEYVLYGKNEIISTVSGGTETWLDTDTTTTMGTIRDSITVSLTKALEATPDAEVTAYLATLNHV